MDVFSCTCTSLHLESYTCWNVPVAIATNYCTPYTTRTTQYITALIKQLSNVNFNVLNVRLYVDKLTSAFLCVKSYI